MRKIGYARVSSPHQNLDRQIAALRAQHCAQIFREKASGKDVKSRPQLEKAIDALGTGDVLMLAEWDRATRSMLDGVHIIERIIPFPGGTPCARACFFHGVIGLPHGNTGRLPASNLRITTSRR